MPNDPSTLPTDRRGGGSPVQRTQKAVRAALLGGYFAPRPVATIAADAVAVPLTSGEPWGGATLPDLPLEPESTGIRSVRTATRPMEAWFLPDSLIAPELGIVLSPRSRRIVAESLNTGVESLTAGPGHADLLRRLTRPRSTPFVGTASLLASPGRNHYHTLVDNIARVCSFGLGPLSSTNVELLHDEPLSPVERYLLDRLLPANVTLRSVEAPGLFRAERVVLPTFPAWRYSGWLPAWYLDRLRQALLPDRPPRRSERLYIARRGSRRLRNEDELLAMLGRHGFRAVELERLSFPEQVELFYDAEAIVATHGAGLTNLLFGNRALVVEISPTRYVFPHYVMLSLALGHHHRVVLGDRTTRWEQFETDPRAVEAELVEGLESLRGRTD